MQLHKQALAFQEASEGRYIYGQDDSAPEASPQGQEVSNGHHAAMRCAHPCWTCPTAILLGMSVDG